MISADTLFDKLKNIKLGGTTCLFTREKCEAMTPLINEINALKKEKNAIILAHSYVSPEIIYGVADFVGDSYELSKRAKGTTADTIIFCAVKFMAETAKLLSPDKTVLIPSKLNGCSLADSVTAADVIALRKKYPNHTFVCYINTSAEVKAYCDVCVTSSNVTHIIESIPNDNIFFLPDKLMGENVKKELQEKGIQKNIELYDGTCYVHEEYDVDAIHYLKNEHSDLQVISHPECDPSIIEASDFVGSTTQMMSHVKESKHDQFFLLTECGLSTRLQLEEPNKKFVGSCTLCKYMKSNSLEEILRVMKTPDSEDTISLDSKIIKKAVLCIDNMFRYVGGGK
ncbi:quinolinate synthase [Candidatus Marinamargulisbacteria bacterium SCGC AG-439-L15]|nr:quinolinate synthase [Candidatus Marinamargulisbacteria bacterium SCGC AG-439-L15]